MGVRVPFSAPKNFFTIMKGFYMTKTIKLSPFSLFFFTIIFITTLGIYFLSNISRFVKRGVDLVGGTYITLDVAVNKVFEEILHQTIREISNQASLKGITFDKITIIGGKATLEISDSKERAAILSLIQTTAIDCSIEEKEHKIIIELDKNIQNRISDNAIDSNIQSLRKRLDPFGAGELLIARQGNSIVIELPNVQDPAQAKRLIGTTAQLTFRPVIAESKKKEDLESQFNDSIGNEVIILKSSDDGRYYVLPKFAEISGSLLKKAHLGYNQSQGNKPVVQFEFNSVGGQKFRELTRECIGKQLAIVIDDEVISAPMVNQEIGSSGIIQGNFTAQAAQELSTLLQSGSFAAPVIYAQERVIEPLLGLKTVKQGLQACLIGLLFLLIASLIMYKISGLFAFIVLLYNLLFALFGMYLIGGTLTLSGIAGLILTVGMAIDASILIFERIREELASGIPFSKALESGFSGAMTVIIDANITHFLVALVLYYVGAGPLKGFAISMIVGIIATILTGIIMLKGIFRYFIKNLGYSKISI